jgi:hypothetical protein
MQLCECLSRSSVYVRRAYLNFSLYRQVLAGIYRNILFRWSNPKMLSRERAFFELLHRLATLAGCSTFPEKLRPRIAREIARIGRTDFFNSTRRMDEELEDAKVPKILAKELFGRKHLGLHDAKDKRCVGQGQVGGSVACSFVSVVVLF